MHPYLNQLHNPPAWQPEPPSLTGITAALWGIFAMLFAIAATMIIGLVMLSRALGPLFELYGLVGR